jgi:hypothetical protein
MLLDQPYRTPLPHEGSSSYLKIRPSAAFVDEVLVLSRYRRDYSANAFLSGMAKQSFCRLSHLLLKLGILYNSR